MYILKLEIPFTITQKILSYKFNKTCVVLVYWKLQNLMKEMKDINKWGDLLCSITGRFNTIKMLILPKLIDTFNEIPFKVPARFFNIYRRGYSEIYMKKIRIS